MNFSIFLTALFLSFSTYIHAEELNLTGSISAVNQCVITLDSTVFNVGTHNASDLPDGGRVIEDKKINANISCTYPTIISVKYSSSVPFDINDQTPLGIVKTENNKSAMNLFIIKLISSRPTADNVNAYYSAIGNQTINQQTTSLSASNDYSEVSGVPGNQYNAFTIINDNNTLVAAQSFNLPFFIGMWSRSGTGWKEDLGGNIIPLAHSVTIELSTI